MKKNHFTKQLTGLEAGLYKEEKEVFGLIKNLDIVTFFMVARSVNKIMKEITPIIIVESKNNKSEYNN
jgi:hypothetical protein